MSNFLLRIGSKSGIQTRLEFDPNLQRPTHEELSLLSGSLVSSIDLEGLVTLKELLQVFINNEVGRMTEKLITTNDLVIFEEDDDPNRPPDTIDDL